MSYLGWSIAATLVVAALISFGSLAPLQRIIAPVFAPIGRAASAVVERFRAMSAGQADRATLQKENDSLKQQLVSTELDRAALQQQIAELQLLRDEADFLKRRSLSGISARVIGRAESSAQLLLVDAGTAQGVKLGQPVLAAGGVLVGIVSDVNTSTSNVRPLTADGTSVGVRVDRPDGPTGILVGERGTGIRLTLVPKSETLQPKQSIITSEVNPQIPSGILIGTISSLRTVAGALFQEATIIPTIPYEQLTVLTILR